MTRPDSPRTPQSGTHLAGKSAPGAPSLKKFGVGAASDLSKGQKAKGIVKATAAGAAGKSTEGKIAGGGLTGAAAGAARAVVSQTKARTVALWGLFGIVGPFAVFMTVVVIISSVLGSSLNLAAAGASEAVSSSTGLQSAAVQAVQSASMNTPTPWTLLEAEIYYESGVGQTVAQQGGVCPAQSVPDTLCPATLNLPPGALTGGGSGASPHGTAATGATSGFDPAVGRNGSVPSVLAANSPDWKTTDTADWDCIRQAESQDNYNQTSGAYGILASTWASLGLLGTPGQASQAEQNSVALEILNYEGHFYGAWNDLCTQPGNTPSSTIAYVPPGVAAPGGGAGSPGVGSSGSPVPSTGGALCQGSWDAKAKRWIYDFSGPYCLANGTLKSSAIVDLGASSTWMADTLGKAFTSDGVGDSMNLTEGISTGAGGMAVVDPGSNLASQNRTDVINALSALPIEHNSPALDQNIYEMAVSWSEGYSPISANTCSPSATTPPASTSITGPNGTSDLLSATQVSVANQIVNAATSDVANQTTQTAAVDAALALSGLNSTNGIFANADLSLTSSVSAFVSQSKSSTLAADAQAAQYFGGPVATYSGWLTGASQLVGSATSSSNACVSSVPLVPGGSPAAKAAVAAAQAEIGVPYIWGGGGTSGPSGSATAPANQVGLPGFDCSGLVQYAFAQAGASLPRTAQDQFTYVQDHSALTTNVSQLQPGDLVFFTDNEPGINHVAIYLGDGNIIQAPQTGMDVSYGTLSGDMGLGFAGGGPAA